MLDEFERSAAAAKTPGDLRRLWYRTWIDLISSIPREHLDVWTLSGGGGMRTLVDDIKRSARGLLRTPGFTVAVLLTLALGIGSTTALYTVVDGVLLKPLPYPDPDGIMSLSEAIEERGDQPAPLFHRGQAVRLQSLRRPDHGCV